MELDRAQIEGLREAVADYYAHHARHDLPWRQPEADGSFDPYKIMVSELMLQQTQVARVILKYHEFLNRFPDISALAAAELGDVLRVWQGLGYNRRAKFLWQAAREIAESGIFPTTFESLVKLPGIGTNTAGAILAYAYNQPVIFVETNIRTVYIHQFYGDQTDVSDTDIRGIVEQTLDHENPREFYWALMDYGSYLKATHGNANRASKHYTKQSRFVGSQRQIRGQVIRLLGESSKTAAELGALVPDERLDLVLRELAKEQLIRQNGSAYSL